MTMRENIKSTNRMVSTRSAGKARSVDPLRLAAFLKREAQASVLRKKKPFVSYRHATKELFINGNDVAWIEDPKSGPIKVTLVWAGAKIPGGAAATKVVLEERTSRVEAEIAEIEKTQVSLYRDMIIERVANRFSTREAAERWFAEGRIPGYGEKTPRQMVEQGKAARVIEAINAIEAGVHT